MIFKYAIFMILRIVNLSELTKSTMSKDFKKNKKNWAFIMGIVLMYFPHLVVCIWSD